MNLCTSFRCTSFRAILLLVGVSASALAQQSSAPIGEVFASDATVQGSVQLSSGGTKVMSGANVTAGDAAARLLLTRGGEVRVCSQTSVAVSASSSGRELMFAMGSGALEADYKLANSADTIMTPDFRILLAGPGTFHFALRSRPNGDTCVQTRASNGASLVLTEMMGDATYQVKPNERVLFRGGKLSAPEASATEDCGCPPPAPPTLRAEAPTPKPTPPEQAVLVAPPPEPKPKPVEEAAAAEPKPNPVHVEVDSPFVFRADDVSVNNVPPVEEPLRVSLATLPAAPAVAALPPEAPAKKKGAFAKLKSFFSNLFK